MSRPVLASLAAIASAMLACGPTHAAGVTRAWVSGRGTDAAGCGAPVNPCRSLQYAHDNIAPGGEIDILDPAGYGAITITKAISIVNDGVGTAGVQQATSGADAITIDAGPSDAVTLRGLNIDGLGVAKDGIGLTEAGKLTIVNCVVRHFTHDGLYLQQANGVLFLTVFNTMAADNSNDGFDIPRGRKGLSGACSTTPPPPPTAATGSLSGALTRQASTAPTSPSRTATSPLTETPASMSKAIP